MPVFLLYDYRCGHPNFSGLFSVVSSNICHTRQVITADRKRKAPCLAHTLPSSPIIIIIIIVFGGRFVGLSVPTLYVPKVWRVLPALPSLKKREKCHQMVKSKNRGVPSPQKHQHANGSSYIFPDTVVYYDIY